MEGVNAGLASSCHVGIVEGCLLSACVPSGNVEDKQNYSRFSTLALIGCTGREAIGKGDVYMLLNTVSGVKVAAIAFRVCKFDF